MQPAAEEKGRAEAEAVGGELEAIDKAGGRAWGGEERGKQIMP